MIMIARPLSPIFPPRNPSGLVLIMSRGSRLIHRWIIEKELHRLRREGTLRLSLNITRPAEDPKRRNQKGGELKCARCPRKDRVGHLIPPCRTLVLALSR